MKRKKRERGDAPLALRGPSPWRPFFLLHECRSFTAHSNGRKKGRPRNLDLVEKRASLRFEMKKGATYQTSNTHNHTPQQQRPPPAHLINNQHLHNRTAHLQTRLDPARQQTQLLPQPQRQKVRRQIILDRSRTTHLRHKLQQRRSPKPREEIPIRE
jgi:hypothetical protein